MEEPIGVGTIQIIGNVLSQIAIELLLPSAFFGVLFENLFEIIG